MLKIIKRKISSFLKVIITSALLILVLLTFANIVTRNVFGFSILWAEELSRDLFVWAIFVGISYSMLEESLMSISFLTDKFKAHGRELLCYGIYWLTGLAFFGIMAVCGTQYAIVGKGAVSSMLGIHLSAIYSAIPYCGYSSVLFLLLNIAIYFQDKKEAQ